MGRLGFQSPNVGIERRLDHVTGRLDHVTGEGGTDMYNDTDTHTGQWKSLVVIIEATINAITDDGSPSSTVLTALALPAGTYISANGTFTSIDLTSGTVAMYRI